MITTKEQIVINQAKEILSREFMREAVLTSSSATKEYLKLHFAGLEHEMFVVVFLDNQHQVIAIENMFRGTIDGAVVYPREVVKRSLELNAAALLLAHNHPSGVSEPSMADMSSSQGLVFHADRASQYARRIHRRLLTFYGYRVKFHDTRNASHARLNEQTHFMLNGYL